MKRLLVALWLTLGLVGFLPQPSEAAISLVCQASNGTSDATDVTVDLSGCASAQNDLGVCVYAIGSAGDRTGIMAENGGTWTRIGTPTWVDDTQDTSLDAYLLLFGASPPTSVTFEAGSNTADGTAAACYVLRGIDTGTPQDATSTVASAASSPTPNPPAIDTATANAWVLAVGASSSNDNYGTATPSAPTNYNNIEDAQGIDTHDIVIAIAWDEIVSPGTENPGTFGNFTGDTGDSWVARTIAIRPAAAAAATNPGWSGAGWW